MSLCNCRFVEIEVTPNARLDEPITADATVENTGDKGFCQLVGDWNNRQYEGLVQYIPAGATSKLAILTMGVMPDEPFQSGTLRLKSGVTNVALHETDAITFQVKRKIIKTSWIVAFIAALSAVLAAIFGFLV